MDLATAHDLVGEAGRAGLAVAATVADPGSLAAATAVRAVVPPDLAAAVLHQVQLRRRARARFGDLADRWWWSSDGLEQATRPVVARWRAQELAARGIRAVADLGCGVGLDAAAAAEAGLAVVAVEQDPVTALLAEANLSPYGVEVQCGDAVDLAPRLLTGGRAVIADPARRTARGRTWRVEDFSPPFPLVLSWLSEHGGVAKLGPGLPLDLIPDWADAIWVSEDGDAVEVALSAGPGTMPGRRRAVALPAGASLTIDHEIDPAPVAAPRRWLYEADPAVARSGGIDTLAADLAAARLAPGIGYLTADSAVDTPLATCFEIVDSFPWKEKGLRSWVAHQGIGTLEIKKRGIEVDPAALRKRLRLQGSGRATIVITPTVAGAQVLVVRRRAQANATVETSY